MNTFIVFAAVLACAYAKPGFLNAAYPYAAAPYSHFGYAAPAIGYSAAPAIVAPAFTKTQYHAQDELGQASYGYAHPGQAHAAVRDAAGNVRGSYAYQSPEGEIRVNYVADAGGFRVESNALPQAPVHVLPGPLVGPAPVLDTPEVVEARAAHAAAHAEALVRSGRKKRGLASVYGTHLASPLTYAAPAVHYAAGPAVHYAAAPALTYAAAPAVHYAAAPALTYAAAPAVHYAAGPAIAAYASPAVAVRAATLTKVVNTPGHAVSYRVD